MEKPGFWERVASLGLWPIRMIAVNLVILLFILFNHDTLDHAVFRFAFVNTFCLIFFLITDAMTYLMLRYLNKKNNK